MNGMEVRVQSVAVRCGLEQRYGGESYTPTKHKQYNKAGYIGRLQANGNLIPINAT
jgi:hypothetical protein